MVINTDDGMLKGRKEMAEYLELPLNTFVELRRKYREDNPCPTRKKITGRPPHRRIVLFTWKSLLQRWYMQVMKQENEEREKRQDEKRKIF